MHKKTIALLIFALAILIQTGILFSFQFQRQQALSQGDLFIVSTVPVDPRSLFRGDYVILNYGFSRIDLASLETVRPWQYKRGKTIFVKLTGDEIVSRLSDFDKDWKAGDAPVERNWAVTGISRQVFKALNENEFMLKGTVESSSGQNLEVRYEIESYFVPEGEGKDIEKVTRQGAVKVLVAVDNKGQAVIDSLYMNGKKVVFE